MKVTRLRVEGEGLDRLIGSLRDKLPDCHTYTSDHVVVLASEKTYFRIESNLLTVIILDVSVPDRYEIELVTGGGGHGPFAFTFGAERDRSTKVIRFLEQICAANGWSLVGQYVN